MRALVSLALILGGCLGPLPPTEPPSPDPDVSRESGDAPPLADLPGHVHRAANEARQSTDIRALAWSAELADVAEAHSRDMAARDYFGHHTPEGVSPQDRARRAGVDCRQELGGGRVRVGVAENLYQITRYRSVRTTTTRRGEAVRQTDWFSPEGLARNAIDGWLDSPGHRRNLLDADATSHGIGVAVDDRDRVFITQVLC